MVFTEVYKPQQGKYVRVGTLIGVAILAGFGMWWIADSVKFLNSTLITAFVVLGFGALWALVGLYVVNKPAWAEFMIMTESEMRKVHWPSRPVVINSTKVVITITLLLGLILFVVDIAFQWLFFAIKVLNKG